MSTIRWVYGVLVFLFSFVGRTLDANPDAWKLRAAAGVLEIIMQNISEREELYRQELIWNTMISVCADRGYSIHENTVVRGFYACEGGRLVKDEGAMGFTAREIFDALVQGRHVLGLSGKPINPFSYAAHSRVREVTLQSDPDLGLRLVGAKRSLDAQRPPRKRIKNN